MSVAVPVTCTVVVPAVERSLISRVITAVVLVMKH